MKRLTLALIKPDLLAFPQLCWACLERVQTEFSVVAAKRVRFSKDIAAQFYASHEGKFFHGRLIAHITSGPLLAAILYRDSSLTFEYWRKMLGSTKVYRTVFLDPKSLRGSFGLTDHRNAVHGSGSLEEFLKEASLVFPEVNLSALTDGSSSIAEEELRAIVFANNN